MYNVNVRKAVHIKQSTRVSEIDDLNQMSKVNKMEKGIKVGEVNKAYLDKTINKVSRIDM